MGDIVRAHVFFTGKVQGVFFRAYTHEKAKELGVAGRIQNIPDGRVEAFFEGTQDMVDAIIDYCKNGQPYARVIETDVKWEEPTGDVNFTIIR